MAMFNVCRGGPASISKILSARRGVFRILTRPSIVPLSSKNTSKSFEFTKWVHLTRKLADESPNHTAESHSKSSQRRNITKFQELLDFDMVHPNVIREIIQNMKLHTLTEVQIATLNEALQGVDIIAQARTGTGKTLGFLIPTIQNILQLSPELAKRQRYSRARPSDIRAIVISPTRELAEQIAVEAEKLCYNTDIVVQVAVGGNSKRQMLLRTQRQGCHLLIATPGRLMDLLSDPSSGIRAPNLTTLVLDEADRLLDDGFSRDIEQISKMLPDRNVKDRQTLLFSATVPREVMHLVRKTLKPDFHFVQTVKEGELATHEKVPQNIIITPGIENWMPVLVQIAKKSIMAAANASKDTLAEQNPKPFKAIVYFSATAQVQLAYQIITGLKSGSNTQYNPHPLNPAQLYIINGSMTQQSRTHAANRFRSCRCGILFSTDVTARGMDFPAVTHVIQFGLPPSREQYIHRVGRTGRGDNTGEGFIIIDKSCVGSAKQILRGLPIIENDNFSVANVDMTKKAELSAEDKEILSQIEASTLLSSRQSKEAAYKSALNNVRSADQALSLARWTKYAWGYDEPPPISSVLANKLGLKRLPGINIGSPTVFENEQMTGHDYNGGSQNRSASKFGLMNMLKIHEDGTGFGNRGDRSGFGNRGDRSGFGNRGDRSGFGNRGDRSGFGNRGDRSGFGNRGDRSGFGNRGDRSGFGNRGDRNRFDDREGRSSLNRRKEIGKFDN